MYIVSLLASCFMVFSVPSSLRIFLQIGCLWTVFSSSVNGYYDFSLCFSIKFKMKLDLFILAMNYEEISVLMFLSSLCFYSFLIFIYSWLSQSIMIILQSYLITALEEPCMYLHDHSSLSPHLANHPLCLSVGLSVCVFKALPSCVRTGWFAACE